MLAAGVSAAARGSAARPPGGPAITAKTADLFGGPSLGTILGVITVGSGIGAGLGSWGAGFIHDLTGSYRIAFWLSIAAYGCGTIAFWLLRSRR
jgi:nitrate/nitrite transporter NarK